ncbi:AraC family transcriptional regulator [Novosphingobium sp. BW1]|uniref:AraC family transcriptional regulator n=1 Tax=Novosphingobium sp. BW1 TaxID=2592621 RepID=UPI0011DEFA4D|nr:AraC family transcriptional regulator [Novosphingobium sp. BW1]TYC94352.1 AraC family transcriptional regulator [Novosphingobium sp. BW1]
MANGAHGEPGADLDRTNARLLRFFPELWRELGGNPVRVGDFSGVAASDPENIFFTYRKVSEALEIAARELNCRDFGMRLAAKQEGTGIFGPLGRAMRSSRTFGEALSYAGAHVYAHSLAAKLTLDSLPGDEGVFAGHQLLLEGAPAHPQLIEQMMLLGHLGALRMTGGLSRARRVEFRHRPISPLATYRRHFGCDVIFEGNRDGMVFWQRDLAYPVIGSDAGSFQDAVAFIDANFSVQRPPLHAEVRGMVMRFLWNGECSNSDVANALNIHARTLHRRLTEHGTSFQKLKDEVRRDLLLYYLGRTNLECGHISERLGFAEQSVLTKTCRRWLGMSPITVRKKLHTSGFLSEKVNSID